jgi:cytochrome oxidase Cu insertion factor (SCO1/SenC/PrrC family)
MLGLAVAALLSACGSSAAPAAAPSIASGTEISQAMPANLMSMSLTNQDGKTVHLSDFAGKTIVISDSMTLCQELCPIDTSTLVATARSYESQAADPSNVVFLTITVDPARDDPAQLAAYRHLYAGPPSHLPQWQLLTGKPSDIAALWKYLGVFVKKVPQDDVVHNWRTGALLTYDIQHSDEVFFVDGDGTERYILDGMPSLDGSPIPKKIDAFMSSTGHRNMTKDKGWTAPQALSVLDWLT